MWQQLTPLLRLFLLLLLLVCIYTTYFASFALLRLRSLRTVRTDNSLQNTLARLNNRSANLRQIITAMSYLFGIIFFLQIQNAFWTPENGRPVGPMVLENFRDDFRFAAAIFLAFFVLHSVQWFVSVESVEPQSDWSLRSGPSAFSSIGRYFRNGFSPNTTKIRPSKIRAISTTIFIFGSSPNKSMHEGTGTLHAPAPHSMSNERLFATVIHHRRLSD